MSCYTLEAALASEEHRFCLRISTKEYKRKYWNVFSVRFGPDGQMEMDSLRNLLYRLPSICRLDSASSLPPWAKGTATACVSCRPKAVAICDLPTLWALSATGEGRQKKWYLPGERESPYIGMCFDSAYTSTVQ